jgi:TonB family protein
MLVDTSGAVTSVKIIQSSGYPSLDQAAIEVVKKQWRFPAGSLRHFWYPFMFELVR